MTVIPGCCPIASKSWTWSACSLLLQDVVLPLPGVDVLYPENEIGQLIRAMLEKDQV